MTNLAQAIATVYDEALLGGSNYVLRPHMEHEKPTTQSRVAEYMAFKRLQQHLPVTFVDPPAEHMVFDYIVNAKKWQLKLARCMQRSDGWRVSCHKKAGRVNGRLTEVQYSVNDFDYLCVQLPESAPHCIYVFPQQELAKRGVIGDASKVGGNVLVYPGRTVMSQKNNHIKGIHWTETFRINLDQDPFAQLQGILDQSEGQNDV
jgi:hypothetical protein